MYSRSTYEYEGWDVEMPPGRPEDPVSWVRERLGFEADEVQERVLRSEARRGILLCTRQWGKSSVTAAKAVYQAVWKPGSLILTVSPCGRQSGEFVRKVGEFSKKLGIRARGDGDNERSVLFPNGSRVVGGPGDEKTVRGFSNVTLLLIDEAARVPDAMYRAVRPMLAVSGGALWLMSTPNGERGFFWEEWTKGQGWERIRVPATECSRIPAAFLEEERRTLGDRTFAQEYMCEFRGEREGAFDMDAVKRAMDSSVRPLRLWDGKKKT